MARGFAKVLPSSRLTVVVNVGDDDAMYGAHVSADLDTVVYTLAGIQGPEGWGVAGDTFAVMERLAGLGIDTTFRLGDQDLAFCLARTIAMGNGVPLHEIVRDLSSRLGVATVVLPASNDPIRTTVQTADGQWRSFQEYFVVRGHTDRVAQIDYRGIESATPAPGVLDAIRGADVVVVAPSNPPLSIWPIIRIPAIAETLASKDTVVAVSPLIGGAAVKGPAATVMADLGLAPANAGVAEAYEGVITHLVIDTADTSDTAALTPHLEVLVTDTLIKDASASARLTEDILGWIS